MTRLTLALTLAAFPAFAEDPNWNGDPQPEPPAPPPVTVTIPNNPGGSVYDPAGEVFFSYCLCNGEYAVARGFSLRSPEFRKQAAEHQCRVLNEERQCAITDQSYAGEGLK